MIHDQGVILDANQVMANLFGFASPADLIGKNGLEVPAFTPESREFLEQSSQPVLTKPFSLDQLRAAVRALMGDPANGLN